MLNRFPALENNLLIGTWYSVLFSSGSTLNLQLCCGEKLNPNFACTRTRLENRSIIVGSCTPKLTLSGVISYSLGAEQCHS